MAGFRAAAAALFVLDLVFRTKNAAVTKVHEQIVLSRTYA